jgi:CRISPR-associated protein Cas2
MPSSAHTWAVAYDVVNDKRRTRLCKFLEGKGIRVQYSVFEVVATEEQMRQIVAEATIARRFDPEEDSLRAYCLCQACRRAATVAGRAAAVVAANEPLVL